MGMRARHRTWPHQIRTLLGMPQGVGPDATKGCPRAPRRGTRATSAGASAASAAPGSACAAAARAPRRRPRRGAHPAAARRTSSAPARRTGFGLSLTLNPYPNLTAVHLIAHKHYHAAAATFAILPAMRIQLLLLLPEAASRLGRAVRPDCTSHAVYVQHVVPSSRSVLRLMHCARPCKHVLAHCPGRVSLRVSPGS
jgi:hypothetical protein